MESAGGVCYPAGSTISQIFFEMSEHCNNSACFFVEIKGTSDICVTFVVYACGKSIRNICLHSGGKKKTADGQILSCAHSTYLCAAVLNYQGRRIFLLRRPLHRVSGMAALGGRRHAETFPSTISDKW